MIVGDEEEGGTMGEVKESMKGEEVGIEGEEEEVIETGIMNWR